MKRPQCSSLTAFPICAHDYENIPVSSRSQIQWRDIIQQHYINDLFTYLLNLRAGSIWQVGPTSAATQWVVDPAVPTTRLQGGKTGRANYECPA
jgi:hypothetical protein